MVELIPYLVGGAALVRAKHDDIGSGVREFLSVKLLVLLEKLHIGTTTDQRVYPEPLSVMWKNERRRSSDLLCGLTSY